MKKSMNALRYFILVLGLILISNCGKKNDQPIIPQPPQQVCNPNIPSTCNPNVVPPNGVYPGSQLGVTIFGEMTIQDTDTYIQFLKSYGVCSGTGFWYAGSAECNNYLDDVPQIEIRGNQIVQGGQLTMIFRPNGAQNYFSWGPQISMNMVYEVANNQQGFTLRGGVFVIRATTGSLLNNQVDQAVAVTVYYSGRPIGQATLYRGY